MGPSAGFMSTAAMPRAAQRGNIDCTCSAGLNELGVVRGEQDDAIPRPCLELVGSTARALSPGRFWGIGR